MKLWIPLAPFWLPTLFVTALGALPCAQQDLAQRVDALEQKNAELEARLAALADEHEDLSLGELVPPMGESFSGLGPAASKVYASDQGLALGGYGEALYQPRNGGTPDTVDMLRAVLYVGYHFSPSWVFNSELEWEHAGEEVGVEFAYLDYLWRAALNFRAGLVLVPMGFVNELHEPQTFLSATRGEVERRILPSTWREPGVGVFGEAGPFTYRAFVIDGLDATGFTAEGLRGGRQEGIEALAEDLAVVGRLDWTATPGLLAGLSLYQGHAGQDQAGLGSTGVRLAEAHAEWRARGLWLRGLAALGEVDDVAELNSANGFTGAASVGEELEGYYLEAGYDVLSLLEGESARSLMPYARYESLDTQSEVPAGFAADPANNGDVLTVGVRFQPLAGLVFKAEYQDFEDAADGMNVALGYAF
ncbi:MAG: hypothetical protein EXS08_15150 [Planctomycetes bacterium]|nr:hypothetical protein [Planctomycetota bacterium]